MLGRQNFDRKDKRPVLALLIAIGALSIPGLIAFETYAERSAIQKLEALADLMARNAIFASPQDTTQPPAMPDSISGAGGRITGLKPSIRHYRNDKMLISEAVLAGTWQAPFGIFSANHARPVEVSARMMIVD